LAGRWNPKKAAGALSRAGGEKRCDMVNVSETNDEGKGGHWSGSEWFGLPAAWITDGTLLALGETERMVLLALASHAGFSDGRAWPGVERLSELASGAASEEGRKRVTKRALRQLESRGLVEVVTAGGGRGRATVYRLKPPKGDSPVTVSDRGEHKNGDSPVRKRVTHQSGKGDSPVTPTKRTECVTHHPARAEESSDARDADGVAHATAEGEPEKTAGGSPTLPHVDPADLRDLRRLMAWAERWTGHPPRLDSREFERLAAAAVRALDRGRDSGRFFVGVARDGCRGVSERDLDMARDWLKDEAHGHRPARGETEEPRRRAAGDAESDRLRRLHGYRVSERPPETVGAAALDVLARIGAAA